MESIKKHVGGCGYFINFQKVTNVKTANLQDSSVSCPKSDKISVVVENFLKNSCLDEAQQPKICVGKNLKNYDPQELKKYCKSYCENPEGKGPLSDFCTNFYGKI